MENGNRQSEPNGSRAGTPPPAYGQRIRTIIRQNSEKVGILAEDVILPMNKRSIKRPMEDKVEVIELDVEQQAQAPMMSPYAPTVVVKSQPESEFPIFMVVISALQVMLFYFCGDDFLMLHFGYDPFRRHELWRYLTIMLAHSSTSHLWGNVVFQLILGVLLEIVHHWKRIGLIYAASVLGGTLFITVMDPQAYGVGASAGVYGLLFAHVSTIILNWHEMDRKCCRVFWLLLYIAYDIGINAFIEFGLNIKTNTSHAGHIGGAITGFLVAILVLRNFEKHPWERNMQKICAGILVGLFVLIVLINITLPSYYLPTEFNFDYDDTYAHFVLKSIKESPDDSAIRKDCEADTVCKAAFEQYIHNGTIPST